MFSLSEINIRNISPSYVIRSLLPEPNGTFIVRYLKANDDVISLIELGADSEPSTPTHDYYVILSIRVDETVYKYHIQHYRLPCTKENIQQDIKQQLEAYNRQKNNFTTGKFTQLKNQLNSPQDERWLFEERYLHDIEFNTGDGKHSQGISKAIWHPERQNDIKVFIKRFHTKSEYFNHELSLLKDLCHFSIIQLYGQYSDKRYNYLVFENGGKSLESLCPLKSQFPKAKMRFIANVGFQVAYAMMYLEKKNIVHRDLTAGNVLINSHGFIRVADFGHAIKKEEGTNTLQKSTTTAEAKGFQFRFLAPECLPDSKGREASTKPETSPQEIYARFSSKSDVWSFGILLIQLMLENPHCPYPNILNGNDIPKHVKQERHIHSQPSECDLDMYMVLKRCWAYEAKDRISFTEIREKMLQLERISQ